MQLTGDTGVFGNTVLNESMNSACAVVASHAIGSAPFLIEDGKNGMLYRDDSTDDLFNKVKWLLDHPQERKEMGEQAYKTITEEWNAENAADKFLTLAQHAAEGCPCRDVFPNGVCSAAPRLGNRWYKGK